MAGVLTTAGPRSPVEAHHADLGVPTGTAELAIEYARLAASCAERLTGTAHTVDTDLVLAHVLLPLLVGDEVASTAPRTAPGGGFVHTDLIADDEQLLEAITAGRPDADAEALAALAQECRLPVTPYRAHGAAGSDEPPPARASGDRSDDPVRTLTPGRVRVVDLTAMWAGPLCTMLLAAWGADVVTIEPDVRPDGLRHSPVQFATLAAGKRRVELDLRRAGDRTTFEALIDDADVLVESFSPRVLPNLGYGPAELRRRNPRLIRVSLRAFPEGSAEHDWVGYGRGVHAASGLGSIGGVPQPVRFAYPDPITGFAAFAAVLDLLGRDVPQSAVVSLAASIAPLSSGGERALGSGPDDVVERLRHAVGTRPGSPIRSAPPARPMTTIRPSSQQTRSIPPSRGRA